MFRNVRFYRVDGAWPSSEHALSEQLSAAAFVPCGPLTERSTGWEAPAGVPDGLLCRRVGGADLVQLRSQARLLPAAAIDEALEARVEDFRERMQQEPSRRERRRLKEQTRDDLLPKALLKSERTRGFVLIADGLVGIDVGSDARAERFLEHLHAPLDGVEIAPLRFERPVGELLTRIFLGDSLPDFALGRECRMQDPSDSRASVRCVDMDLTDQTVRRHVRDGMKLTHLAVQFGESLSCVIDENGAIAKLRYVGEETGETADDEDPLARLDAEVTLLTGTLRRLVGALEHQLGGFETG